MIWLLIWMQMVQGEGPSTMKYYHLETFTTQDGCKRELINARVLITTASETMDCIMVDRGGE